MSQKYVYGYEDHELERLGLQHQVWQDSHQALAGLVKAGLLEHELRDAFLAEWEKLASDPAAVFFGSPVMEVIGRRCLDLPARERSNRS